MASSDVDYDMSSPQLHIIEWDHLNLWKFYPLAMASSWSVRCLLYPMSVVKSRLQLQRQNHVYTGMRHAFVDILSKEGPSALYRGFWMTLPQLSASFLYSSVYEKLRDVIHVHTGIESSSTLSALAGSAASTATQLVFVPTDIIAQHMMIAHNPTLFGGSKRNVAVSEEMARDGLAGRRTLGLRVVRAVYRVDGIYGFYRGFFSSIMVYIPSSMVFWSTYYQVLAALKRVRRNVQTHVIGDTSEAPLDLRNYFVDQAVAGSIGGMFAAVCTNPLEMIRIRCQVHRTSLAETIRRLIRYEGTGIFTKGLAPRVINNGIYSCLIMLGYETVKKLCVLPEYQHKVVW